jgi:hypothetical protein
MQEKKQLNCGKISEVKRGKSHHKFTADASFMLFSHSKPIKSLAISGTD